MNPYEPHNDSFKPTAGPGPNSMAFRANLAPTSTTQDDDMYRLPDVPAHFQTDPAASSALPIDPSLMSGPAGAKEGNSAPPPRKKRKKSPAQPTKRKKRVETPVEADEESDGDDDGAGSSPPASGRARSVSLAASATTGKTAGRPSTKNAFKVKLPKGIDVPPIPTLFQGHSNLGKLLDSVKQVVVAGGGEARVFDGEGEDVMKEEQLQELDRAMNPRVVSPTPGRLTLTISA